MKLDTETTEKLVELFSRETTKEHFARLTRKFIYETISLLLAVDDVLIVDRDAISEGYYYLHELCEILDPKLTGEN